MGTLYVGRCFCTCEGHQAANNTCVTASVPYEYLQHMHICMYQVSYDIPGIKQDVVGVHVVVVVVVAVVVGLVAAVVVVVVVVVVDLSDVCLP